VIVLDTNVVSEIIRPEPNARVLRWLRAHPYSSVSTTTITRGELLYGVQLLPDGKRKAALRDDVLSFFASRMAGPVLSFDSDASDAYAEIYAKRRKAGKPNSPLDAMIAAIARSRGSAAATRNIKDFCNCGIDVINPWND
jgi:predicted nucleic acid-binding protein